MFLYIKKALRVASILLLSVPLMQCSEDMITPQPATQVQTTEARAVTSTACSTCTYVVPATAGIIDGAALGLKPGAVICFDAAIKYVKSLTFKNIIGTATQPIIITNCGGPVNLTVIDRPFNFKTSNSKYFRITGGDTNGVYGIRISGSTSNGLVLCERSTNFEVDHVEVFKVGFAGIMAKTDPTCDDATIRANFTMRDISLHDNFIHETGGEGFYVGHSFYGGYTTSCGVRLPHLIEGAKIFNNKVSNSGWDGIQLGCASTGAELYNNTITNYATKNKADQNYGIILGAGTGGACYGNYINGGSGTAMAIFGLADNLIHDNLIVNAGRMGIFCDERTAPGAGYVILNNTIINPKAEGMRIYAETVPHNVVKNNIIVNPGSYATYATSSYIMKLNSVVLDMSNNYTTRNIADLKFIDPLTNNYRLLSTSPAINKGASISSYNIPSDFYKGARLNGLNYDIGASEY